MNTTTTETTPRAWVGCLGCYNGGALVGKWLDGENCADLQAAGLTDSDERCLRCGAEEFWVMDHENYSGVLEGECSPQEAQDKAELLSTVDDNEREILIAWLGNGMGFDLDAMREAYIGEFSTDRDMAEEYAENCDLLSTIPENLRYYFDFNSYARDLMNDIWEFSGHYFWNN